jgi:hypothetical protein
VGNVLTWNEPALSSTVSSNPAWSYGCFSYLVTVNYLASDPANFAGAVKNNTTDANYTPMGGSPVTKTANASHTLPAPIYGPGYIDKT